MKYYAVQNDWLQERIGAPGPWVLRNPAEVTRSDKYGFVNVYDIVPMEIDFIDGVEHPKAAMTHRYLGPLPIDIDIKEERGIMTVEDARKVTLKVATIFGNYGLNPSSQSIRYFFSGKKGYHIEVHHGVFGVTEHEYALPLIYKILMQRVHALHFVDPAVYSQGKGRMWRLPNVPRLYLGEDKKVLKGVCKIPLTYQELKRHSDEHAEMAVEPRVLDTPFQGVPVAKLVKIFEELREADLGKKSFGLTRKHFTELIPINFKGAECIQRILSNHPSVNDAANFHEMVFQMCIYFKHIGVNAEGALRATKEWLTKKESRSYLTPDARLDHMAMTFDHVSGNADYKFSCQSCRNMVNITKKRIKGKEYRYPELGCSICPLNLHFTPDVDNDTWGIHQWDNKYQEYYFNYHPGVGEEKGWKRRSVSKSIFDPEAIGVDSKTRETGWSFCAKLLTGNGGVLGPFVFDTAIFNTGATLRAAVSSKSKMDWSAGFDDLTARKLEGVRALIIMQLKNMPYYLHGRMAQGMYKFKANEKDTEQWYWVDRYGCKDSEWQDSINVRLDTPKPEEVAPWINISQSSPIVRGTADYHKAAELINLLGKTNIPSVIYPIMSWVTVSLFSQRLKEIAKKSDITNLRNIPAIYVQGEAGSGKTEFTKNVLAPLLGYAADKVLELPGTTNFTVRSNIMPRSNCCPIILDEVKEELFNDSSRGADFSPRNMKTLIRAVWDNNPYQRGGADLSTNTYDCDAPLALLGPSLPKFFDTAMKDRTVVVKMSPEASRARINMWQKFNSFPGKEDLMRRIGATIIFNAMTMSDEEILAIYADVNTALEKYLGPLRDRQYYSAVKLAFGSFMLEYLFETENWDYADSLKYLLGVYGINDSNFSIGPGQLNSSGLDVDLEKTDWDYMMIAILELCTHKALDDVRLRHGSDFWFTGELTGKPYLFLDLNTALQRYPQYMRRLGRSMYPDMHLVKFAEDAVHKGFAEPFGNKNTVVGVQAPAGDVQQGPIIRFSVERLLKPFSRRQAAFSLFGVVGSDVILQRLGVMSRSSEDAAKIKPIVLK